MLPLGQIKFAFHEVRSAEVAAPGFKGLGISLHQSPAVGTDLFQIEQGEDFAVVVVVQAVEPFVVDQRTVVCFSEGFNQENHIGVRAVIVEGDDVGQLRGDFFNLGCLIHGGGHPPDVGGEGLLYLLFP